MTAEDARKLTDYAHSIDSDYLKEDTEKILEFIADAARHGQSSMTYNHYVHDVIRQRLINLGYTYKWYDGMNWEDTGYASISW